MAYPVWHGIWCGLACLAWYMVWPGKHGRVYGMYLRAWHDICYGLVGMAWYMVLLGKPGMAYGIAWRGMEWYIRMWRDDMYMVWPDGHGMVYDMV